MRNGVRALEQGSARRLGGERGEGHGADEALGVVGEHGDNVRAGVDEAPAQLGGLVRGDAAGDSEDDPPAAQGRQIGAIR